MPRLVVDRDLCISSGNCAYVDPANFVLDDESMPVVSEMPVELTPELLEAIEMCPTRAIRLEE
jgi:ferredoxin